MKVQEVPALSLWKGDHQANSPVWPEGCCIQMSGSGSGLHGVVGPGNINFSNFQTQTVSQENIRETVMAGLEEVLSGFRR